MYALSLGCMLSVDEFATEGMVPEDLGHKGSIALLEEVRDPSDDEKEEEITSH